MEIWQRGFTDHGIRDEQDYINHRDYIRQNAVGKRLVWKPEEYPYCSAYPGFMLDPAPQKFTRAKAPERKE
jgi:hypothetical protein